MIDKLMQHGIGIADASPIKSIQRGYADIAGSTKNLEVNISEIDKSKSIIRVSPESKGLDSGSLAILGKITSNSKIELERETSHNVNIGVYWEVIEFNEIKSKQEGQVLVGYGQGFQEINISEIDIEKSIIVGSFKAVAQSSTLSMVCVFNINTSTQIAVSRYNQNKTVHYQVIEFN